MEENKKGGEKKRENKKEEKKGMRFTENRTQDLSWGRSKLR